MAPQSQFRDALEALAKRHATVRLTYHGGTNPEGGRLAVIVAMDRDVGTIRIREPGHSQSKTLLIERIGWVVDADGDGETINNDALEPAPRRAQSTKIADPVAYFSAWAYTIERCHWEMLGVTRRPFMVNRRLQPSWAIDTPPRIDMLEGSIFYRGDEFVQVAFNAGDDFVEVHLGAIHKDPPITLEIVDKVPVNREEFFKTSRTGWLLRQGECFDWLRTGVRPSVARELNRSTSSCDGLMRMLLPEAPDATGATLTG